MSSGTPELTIATAVSSTSSGVVPRRSLPALPASLAPAPTSPLGLPESLPEPLRRHQVMGSRSRSPGSNMDATMADRTKLTDSVWTRVVEFWRLINICEGRKNKAYGQSLKVIGIDLRQGQFSYGKIYAACFKVDSPVKSSSLPTLAGKQPKVGTLKVVSVQLKHALYHVFPRRPFSLECRNDTYVDGDPGQREELGWRLVLRHEAVELVAVLVPLDGVQRLALQVEVALQLGVLVSNRVHRDAHLHQPQAASTCAKQTATVAERLARSPPTNRVQSPAGSPDFRKWESCRTMPLVGERRTLNRWGGSTLLLQYGSEKLRKAKKRQWWMWLAGRAVLPHDGFVHRSLQFPISWRFIQRNADKQRAYISDDTKYPNVYWMACQPKGYPLNQQPAIAHLRSGGGTCQPIAAHQQGKEGKRWHDACTLLSLTPTPFYSSAFTVSQCWTQWEHESTHTRSEGSVRCWRITSREDRLIVRHAVSTPRVSLRYIQGLVTAAGDTPVSTSNISRRLAERNLIRQLAPCFKGYYAVVRRQQCSPIGLTRPEPRPQPYRTSLGRIGLPGEGSSGAAKIHCSTHGMVARGMVTNPRGCPANTRGEHVRHGGCCYSCKRWLYEIVTGLQPPSKLCGQVPNYYLVDSVYGQHPRFWVCFPLLDVVSGHKSIGIFIMFFHKESPRKVCNISYGTFSIHTNFLVNLSFVSFSGLRPAPNFTPHPLRQGTVTPPRSPSPTSAAAV
ncbi:hypothetical protein PR048_002414 [Dryococelus australis]|uniref:Uncharacterized protein n=1 Tax=Dryococelus australis TaxID=614101 RepID=A0ABQ9IML3_9NEOP|nr:hypothetical protein PR048_002414 [Dryococelus australis]